MSFSSVQLSLRGLFSLRRKRTRTRRVATRALKTYKNDEQLKTQWDTLIRNYFPNRLDLTTYTVSWSSRRQRRTLGSCNLRQRHISVAIELQDEDCAQWIDPLLFHELCHAVIGLSVERSSGKRQWHGTEFKRLEAMHPGTQALDEWMHRGGFSAAVRRHRARIAARARHAKNTSNKTKAASEEQTGSRIQGKAA